MKTCSIALVACTLALVGCGDDATSPGGAGGSAGTGGSAGAGGEGGEGGEGGIVGDGCAEQCTDTEYCAGDSCTGEGTCEERPPMCSREFAPVCGCDGTTYGNACEAESAGVRVDFDGQCPCSGHDDCFDTQYCDQGEVCARSTGTCKERPQLCSPVFMPVCGCDGADYSSVCDANAAGVQVSAEQPCDCNFDAECDPDEFCNASTCDGPGYCDLKPDIDDCPDEEDDLRACDGVGYQNGCQANANGTRAVVPQP